MPLRRPFALLLAVPLAACSTVNPTPPATPPAPPSLLPLSDIVNAIKCELGETFADGRYLDTLVAQDKDGADIGATLDLADVAVVSSSASAGVSIPFGGLAISPSVSGGKTDSAAQSLSIKFSYDLQPGMTAPAFCAVLPVRVKGRPFVAILDGIRTEYAKIEQGAPRVRLGSVSYTSEFAVEKSVGGGAGVTFLLFSVGGSHSVSHAHKQSLTLDFNLGLAPARIQ